MQASTPSSVTTRRSCSQSSWTTTKRAIPLRFSVLAGEIVHHLRSCLDHIVWHFSNPAYRTDERKRRYIEFPDLKTRRVRVRFTQYQRKKKGITDPRVRKLILACQPYMRPILSSLFCLLFTTWTSQTNTGSLCCALRAEPSSFRRKSGGSIVQYRNRRSRCAVPRPRRRVQA